MAKLLGILLPLLYTKHCICEENDNQMATRAQLHDELFSQGSYNSRVIPFRRDPVSVVHALRLRRIIDFDPHTRTMIVNAWSTMTWSDSRIVWNPPGYGDVKRIWVPIKTIWMPDIRLESGGPSPSGDSIAVVRHNGKVYYAGEPTVLTAYCSEANTSHEFECQFKYLSWTYSRDMLDLQINNNSVNIHYVVARDDSKWQVLSFTVNRNVQTYACCAYTDLVYTVRIRPLHISTNTASMSGQTGGQCAMMVQHGYTVYVATLGPVLLWCWYIH